ncbi:hypothetical protein HPP92_017050 [Vanilla planifolia]|uniref:Uncharacterized protein n=1 Tax=Vanilla planifolia TaxID=51239 RepID=A0A835QH86_VANPL|nr:hypothetical protein HPP92_017050 [Vanilla planifolia]
MAGIRYGIDKCAEAVRQNDTNDSSMQSSKSALPLNMSGKQRSMQRKAPPIPRPADNFIRLKVQCGMKKLCLVLCCQPSKSIHHFLILHRAISQRLIFASL